MKRVLIILVLAISVLSGCSELKDSIKELQDRVDLLENVTIANIDQQIDAIRNSIASLNATDSELAGYTETIEASVNDLKLQLDAVDADLNALKNEFGSDVSYAEKKILEHLEDVRKALEENIDNLMKTIEVLNSRNEDLGRKIEELEEYLESRLEDNSEWSESTFATLEQYAAIQSEISAIKALAEQTDKELAGLEKELRSKIDNDIKDTIEMLRAEMTSDISALETLINSVAEACEESVAEAAQSISASYMDAIAASIAECEKSMKTWVNARLAEGYYDIAEVDAEIAALSLLVMSSDGNLEELIREQGKALAAAKAEMDKAYKSVIDEIVANNGRIDEVIDTKVNAAVSVLQSQIDSINMAIDELRERIEELEDRVDKLEGDKIKTIEEQIAAINVSVEDLKGVDAELKGYVDALQNTASDLQSKIDATNDALAVLESDLEGQITASEQKVLDELNTVKTALEGQLATINNTIATLQAKDAELDKKIAELQTYVDSEITATEDWATATFSTLEQYEAVQTAISEINALIKSTQESITALEEKLDKKIDDDIAAAVADVNADIAAKVTEITDAYTAAIATVKEDITAAYTDAIKTAITASETSMKEWVNGVLADGYYTKAEIDGMITALQTQVTEGDTELQKEIDDLEAALAQAESDLTAAYEKAIKDAIDENNGKISADIEAAVKTAQDNLQAQIDAINSEIQEIKNRLTTIESAVGEMINVIQSISYIPEYSDGKAVVFNGENGRPTLKMDFYIRPVMPSVEQDEITVNFDYSSIPTRASSLSVLPISEYSYDSNEGKMSLTVDASSLDMDFFGYKKEASVFINVKSGKTDYKSEYIPVRSGIGLLYNEEKFEVFNADGLRLVRDWMMSGIEGENVSVDISGIPGWEDLAVSDKLSCDVLLKADIDLPTNGITVNIDGEKKVPSRSNWKPLGKVNNPSLYDSNFDIISYTGTFDGGGHTIRGLRMVEDSSSPEFALGFFSVLLGTVKNLTFEDAIIAGSTTAVSVGVISGGSLGVTENCHIRNSYVYVGQFVNGEVVYSGAVTGMISIHANYSGYNGQLYNCTVDSKTVVYTDSPYFNTGGIVGYAGMYTENNGNECIVMGCVSSGVVKSAWPYINTNSGYSLGGVVGRLDFCNVVACASTGLINDTNNVVGYVTNASEKVYASWVNCGEICGRVDNDSQKIGCCTSALDIIGMNNAIQQYNNGKDIENYDYCPYYWIGYAGSAIIQKK